MKMYSHGPRTSRHKPEYAARDTSESFCQLPLYAEKKGKRTNNSNGEEDKRNCHSRASREKEVLSAFITHVETGRENRHSITWQAKGILIFGTGLVCWIFFFKKSRARIVRNVHEKTSFESNALFF